MKWRREEYIELMTFGDVGKEMFVELFGPLIGLEEEWRAQGATEEELEMTGFDWDYVPVVTCGGKTGRWGGFKPQVLEETADYLIQRDELGRTVKLVKGVSTIAHPLSYPVKTMDDWLRVKPFFTYCAERINWEQVERARQAQRQGALVLATIPGGFDLPRSLMGEEMVCLCYYDQPELMHDILQTITDTAFRVLEQVSNHLTIDNLRVHEDMAGKSGCLIGPNLIVEYIKPYYRKIWDLLSARGTKLFSQDSDGNMNSVIDVFLDSGVNVMYPLEPAAGMDMVELRKKYGKRVAFKGGIDKHVLRRSKDEIRKELEYKMQPLMQGGGTVFGLDHRIPNGTPLENYKYYIQVGRELLGLPPRDPQQKGWARMAF
ncbi:MAG: hypothetical protein GX050_09655 [Firmicutes bacterium]|nr:hypothetical protein [Bacillota bacterium]